MRGGGVKNLILLIFFVFYLDYWCDEPPLLEDPSKSSSYLPPSGTTSRTDNFGNTLFESMFYVKDLHVKQFGQAWDQLDTNSSHVSFLPY